MTQAFDLTGKTVVITGGAGFLGQLFVTALKEAGATVVSTDIAPDADIQLDVTRPDSISQAFAETVEKHGRIDVVVNNAAIDPKFDAAADANTKLFEKYPEDVLRKSLEVNLLGCTLVAQAAVKQMLEQGKGHLINIASIYGLHGPDQGIYPDGTQKPVDYAITKGGVIMLTKWLATTYGVNGIRANTYTLGGVVHGHSDEFQKAYGSRTPLGRMVAQEEVGPPLVFLASDAAVGMTGANLVVDGGWGAW
jgi:NAD(P)-dependent dehydrogenase (short-subunit alcohol dehydrogenase family)